MFGFKLVKETRWNGIAKKALKLSKDYNEKLHDYMYMDSAVGNAIFYLNEGDEEKAIECLKKVLVPLEDHETKLFPNYNLIFFKEEFEGKGWRY